MYELETDDWDHYFHKLEDENGNIYFQNVLKAQWYEAALLFYNAVVDLSWIACYISAEYFIYVDGKPVEVEGLTPIEEAYNALRKAEGDVYKRQPLFRSSEQPSMSKAERLRYSNLSAFLS